MRALLSISFACLLLLKGFAPGMDFACELQKLPNLWDHYQEHKTCNGNSFLNFLINDYLGSEGNAQDHDDAEHNDLPFHGGNQCGHSSVFYANVPTVSLRIFGLTMQLSPAYYHPTVPSSFTDTPFQPPKV